MRETSIPRGNLIQCALTAERHVCGVHVLSGVYRVQSRLILSLCWDGWIIVTYFSFDINIERYNEY